MFVGGCQNTGEKYDSMILFLTNHSESHIFFIQQVKSSWFASSSERT